MRLLVAITGASGVIFGIRTLEVLKEYDNVETHLVISKPAEKMITLETSYSVKDVRKLAKVWYSPDALDAPVASGSFPTSGMAVVPCSVKTLAGVAGGFTDNLILRAADVTVKEGRRLVLVVRETPLSAIHLENMLKLARVGVTILPPIPVFYNSPKKLTDIIDYVVGKVLDRFEIEHNLYKRWKAE